MTLDELLLEWSYRSERGYPTLDNPSDVSVLKTILEKGKTNLGDKTIADSLDFIIKELKINQNYSEVFKSATKQALEDFKGKKIKIGRARMFEDKTKELDDPGMYALNKLSQAF